MLTIDFLLNGDEAPNFRARRMDSGTIILTAENEKHGSERVVLHLDEKQAREIMDRLYSALCVKMEAAQ